MPQKFTRIFDKSELEELFLSTVKPRNVNQKIFRFKLIQLFLNKGFLLCRRGLFASTRRSCVRSRSISRLQQTSLVYSCLVSFIEKRLVWSDNAKLIKGILQKKAMTRLQLQSLIIVNSTIHLHFQTHRHTKQSNLQNVSQF